MVFAMICYAHYDSAVKSKLSILEVSNMAAKGCVHQTLKLRLECKSNITIYICPIFQFFLLAIWKQSYSNFSVMVTWSLCDLLFWAVILRSVFFIEILSRYVYSRNVIIIFALILAFQQTNH